MQSKVTIWNQIISTLPDPHFLQTYEWGQVKAEYGWEPYYIIWMKNSCQSFTSDQVDSLNRLDLLEVMAATMILKRRIPIGGMAARLSVLYAPKGPLMDWTNEALCERVLDDLQSFVKKQGSIFLKIDPDVVLGTGIPGSEEDVIVDAGQQVISTLKRRGWEFSLGQIQFRNTVLIDLSASEDEILARMKQKTRYNVRLAGRKDVVVRVGTIDDLPGLYKMYAETSVRDGFVIRDGDYYREVWGKFMGVKMAEPLIAEVNGEPVAAIFVFYFSERAYYVYGMSRAVHREKMPAYLLQWEAMKRARARGCRTYDLWGGPEEFDESDPMWGVFRFKRGLGGKVVRTLGAWDYPPNKIWYRLYAEIIPRILDIMRARGKKVTSQQVMSDT
jgi:lipid II:glycine glycyltransferase (peptidoglycan interpeptide bridge formation enzyme)